MPRLHSAARTRSALPTHFFLLGLAGLVLAGCEIDTSTDRFPSAHQREAARAAPAVANCLQPALARLRWPVMDELRPPHRRNAADGSVRFVLEGFPTFAYSVDIEPAGPSAARVTARVGGGVERILQSKPTDVMARLRAVVNSCTATRGGI